MKHRFDEAKKRPGFLVPAMRCQRCKVYRYRHGGAWHYANVEEHLGTGLHDNCGQFPSVPWSQRP